MSCTQRSRNFQTLWQNIETEFENTYVYLSGAWMGSYHEKNGGQKSCNPLPLKGIFQKCQIIVFSYLLHLLYVLSKNYYYYYYYYYYFHVNIFRHQREITFVKLRIKTDTWEFTDLAVWCTPGSQTPRCVSYRGVRLCSMMHTTESDSTVCIIVWSFFETFSFLYSVVWCTLQSQTPQWDAHLGAF